MNILFIDTISPTGHKNFDSGVLRCLSGINDLRIDVIIRNDFIKLDQYNINTVEFIDDKFIPENILKKYKNIHKYRLFMRYNQYVCLKKLFSRIKNKKYDLILFACIDLLSFFFATIGIKKRCAFIDHSISDLSESNFKLFFWRHINKKIEAVLMEDYINQYIKNELRARDKTWIVHHTLPSIDNNMIKNSIQSSNNKLVFSPGESIDEVFVENLIKNSKEIPNDTLIIIKSRKYTYQSDKLLVYNRRLTDSEYYGYLNDCSYLLIAYNENYNYKTSGVLYEAVKHHRKVLIHSNNSLIYYNKKYPNNIKKFNNIEDLFIILKGNLSEIDEEEFSLIYNNYSDEKITSELRKMIYNQ